MFNVNGYEVIRSSISKEHALQITTELKILKDLVYHDRGWHEDAHMGDEMVDNSFSWYGALATEALLLVMLPKIEQVTGKKLYPSYTYSRIYYKGAVMARHLDRESCEYSATMTLSVDETPWEIWMKNYNGDDNALSLDVGDCVVYRGEKLEHWRDEYKGKEQVQVFLHYVDQDGPHASFKYDNRKLLGMPSVNGA